jgi:hypothetical protein
MSGNVLIKKSANDEIAVECEAGVVVNDYVYINASGKADKADASSVDTMPCIGKVFSIKNNICKIRKVFVENDYTALPREVLFISDVIAGSLSIDPPTTPNSVIQPIGLCSVPNQVIVEVNQFDVIIRS